MVIYLRKPSNKSCYVFNIYHINSYLLCINVMFVKQFSNLEEGSWSDTDSVVSLVRIRW